MASAYDFSIVPGPAPQALKDAGAEGVLVYSFGARQSDEYLDECRALGLEVVWIWERNTDSIFGGYDYAVSECRLHEARAKPGELTYVACDTNDSGVGGRDLTPFLRGWSDTTRESVFGLYGSSGAIRQGQRFGGKCARWWGVVNWINGGGPDNAPENIAYWASVGAHLVQLIGSPVDGTDQNLILRDDWATIGAVAPATHPLLILLEDDVHFETDPADRRDIWAFSGGVRKKLTLDEWLIEKAKYALTFAAAGLAPIELKPFAGTPATFASTPDVLTLVGGGNGGSGPLALSGTFVGQAA